MVCGSSASACASESSNLLANIVTLRLGLHAIRRWTSVGHDATATIERVASVPEVVDDLRKFFVGIAVGIAALGLSNIIVESAS